MLFTIEAKFLFYLLIWHFGSIRSYIWNGLTNRFPKHVLYEAKRAMHASVTVIPGIERHKSSIDVESVFDCNQGESNAFDLRELALVNKRNVLLQKAILKLRQRLMHIETKYAEEQTKTPSSWLKVEEMECELSRLSEALHRERQASYKFKLRSLVLEKSLNRLKELVLLSTSSEAEGSSGGLGLLVDQIIFSSSNNYTVLLDGKDSLVEPIRRAEPPRSESVAEVVTIPAVGIGSSNTWNSAEKQQLVQALQQSLGSVIGESGVLATEIRNQRLLLEEQRSLLRDLVEQQQRRRMNVVPTILVQGPQSVDSSNSGKDCSSIKTPAVPAAVTQRTAATSLRKHRSMNAIVMKRGASLAILVAAVVGIREIAQYAGSIRAKLVTVAFSAQRRAAVVAAVVAAVPITIGIAMAAASVVTLFERSFHPRRLTYTVHE